ncbi:flagellin N-terminal helical domain-containing protein [Alteromonas macleodii]|uniref:flagellin N-terminal helical domain-containing protein n=1 Tax=Alteromonas macleodii TaxID=28108 RepID=UPI00066BD04F|nr:flagellin [Alteromonas macleodii]RZP35371.1 MAG: flagellin [Alteromonas sp.]CAI3967723.1 flagellin [Alteromonas macleodii]VTP55656.1 flagellin [Alteromonas macleodii]
MLSVSGNYQSLGLSTLQNTALSTRLERLSSGLRINSAADDSAGLQISNRLASEKRAYTQLNRNLNDGISYAQIAEGGLQESAAILQRMRQLAIQSQNGINSVSDRAALDKEFQQLKNALNGIAYNTEAFNRLPLVDDSDLLSANVPSISDTFTNGVNQSMTSGLRSIAYIPAGSTNIQINLNDNGANDDIQVFTVDGKHLAGTPLSAGTWNSNGISNSTSIESTFFLPTNGYEPTASYDDSNLLTIGSATIDGNSISFTGDQNASGNLNETLTIASNAQPLIISVIGSGAFNVTASWTSLGNEGGPTFTLGPVDITATNQLGVGTDFIELTKTPATLTDLGLDGTSLQNESDAESALERIDSALQLVSESRAVYGAKINQMASAIRNNAIGFENISRSHSQITDADFASETALLTQAQIVEQASISVRAQAKSSDEQVLGLLNDTVNQSA